MPTNETVADEIEATQSVLFCVFAAYEDGDSNRTLKLVAIFSTRELAELLAARGQSRRYDGSEGSVDCLVIEEWPLDPRTPSLPFYVLSDEKVTSNVTVYNAAYAGALNGLAARAPQLLMSSVPCGLAEAVDTATHAELCEVSEVEVFAIQSWAARLIKSALPENLEREDVAAISKREYWQERADHFATTLKKVRGERKGAP